MALPNLRPLSFGEILDGAFSLYRRNFVTFAVTALIPTGLMIAGFALMGGAGIAAMSSEGTPASVGPAMYAGLVVMVVALVGFMVMYGALTRQAAQSYTGQPTSVGDGMRAGLRSVLPLLGAAIIAWIGLVVAVFGVALVGGIIGAVVGQLGTAIAMLAGLVMVVVFVGAGLGAVAMLFAVLPAIVVEGAGPLRALERSFELARGALGRVVGLMVVTLVITYLPMIAIMWMTGSFAQFANPQAVPSPTQFMTQQVLAMGVSVFTGPFMMAVIVLLYFDRRVRTEGLDVQMMTDRLAVAGD